MVSTFRSVTRSFGGWLFAGGVVLVGAGSCGNTSEPRVDAERAFVETPSGRRVAVAARSAAHAVELRLPDDPFVIAKFEGAIPVEARSALARAGFREVGYLPYDALLLERPAGAAKGSDPAFSAASFPGMAAWVPYRAEDRVSRDLLPEAVAARKSADPVPVMIHVMPGHDRRAARALAVAQGGEVAGEGQSGAFGRISVLFAADNVASAVQALSQQGEIFFVERIHHIGLLNDKTAGTIQSGVQGHASAQTPIWEHGIRGEGQIVGLIDTGIDANSCYFNGASLPVTNTWSSSGGYGTTIDASHRKIIAYDFLWSCDQYPGGNGTTACDDPTNHKQWDDNNHGTHVSGTIVGDSDSNPAVYAGQDGMAPAAKIVAQDGGYGTNNCADCPGLGCPVISLIPLFEQSRTQGAAVHNNSWGDNENATPPGQSNYSARSQDVDQYMWDHRDFLIVFAAGNSGAGNAEFSVGSPSTNKNGLSIGGTRTSNASTSDENISGFSSRGWSADGRIKPDIMAPAYNNSALNDNTVDGTVNCGTTGGGGTSYAAPVAVGAAALVRQYFMDGFYPSGAKNAPDAYTPSAALIKAMLINSAVSMTGTDNSGGSITPIPSNEQGWGRIRLDKSMFFTGGARKLYIDDHRQGLPAGATTSFTYTVNAVAATEALKVTLGYTDFPGMPDSPPTSVSVTDSTTWNASRLVNDLDLTVTGPSGTYIGNVFSNGASATGGTSDKRNNVEQVLLAAPMAGTYTITVKATNIVQANQDFALVVTGAFTSVGGPPGGTDAGVDATPPGDAPPMPPQDATNDQTSNDAPPIDVAPPRPDGTGGTGGTGGGGSGGTGGSTGGSAGRGGAAGTAGASGSAGASGGAADAGSVDAGSAGKAGSGGGGTGGSGGSADITPATDDSGCGCSIPRRDNSSRAGLLGLGLGLALVARRRRR